MADTFDFSIAGTEFNEDYTPSKSSRITTNFANLARGENRRENLRNALTMINRRFNSLAHWDNPRGDRYSLELEIVSANVHFDSAEGPAEFPLLEVLDTTVLDHHNGTRSHGIVGNNFSSYVRDYDFSVVLPAAADATGKPSLPEDFGDLHGRLFQHFLDSEAYRQRFEQLPVVCISVSTSKTYHRTGNSHPVLGLEYEQDDYSLTDAYFGKMGLRVRYFMPAGSVAPLAFYFRGDLLNDYSDLQLASIIATMETFQKIYRPEVYNANSPAPAVYQPSLSAHDFSRTLIDYDREERTRLGASQGRYTEEHFITPNRELLDAWAAGYPTPVA
ncbi:putative oxygenase MesX [Glutamicibacter sp.]|uniref:putative oxygenase MesX n=1 Tax=Glutamicibacter sp. TaxID=1931995 RepID=UPI0028BEBD3F|nr:putative oxygenase MesX [Glutamicibacter sp.]